MKKFLSYMLVTALFTTLVGFGCQRGPQNSVEGEEGESLTVSVPDTVVGLKQGDDTEVSIVVTRKKLPGDIDVKFSNLPEKVAVVGDLSFDENTNQKFVTLRVNDDAKLVKEHQITVTAVHKKLKASDALKITVLESLKNRAKRKQAFVDKAKKQLEQIDKALVSAQEKAKSAKGEEKAKYLRRISDLVSKHAEIKKKHEKIVAAPVESWDRMETEVREAIEDLNEATENVLENVPTKKE